MLQPVESLLPPRPGGARPRVLSVSEETELLRLLKLIELSLVVLLFVEHSPDTG